MGSVGAGAWKGEEFRLRLYEDQSRLSPSDVTFSKKRLILGRASYGLTATYGAYFYFQISRERSPTPHLSLLCPFTPEDFSPNYALSDCGSAVVVIDTSFCFYCNLFSADLFA